MNHIRYYIKSKQTGKIHTKEYSLKQIEVGGLSVLFDVEDYEIIDKREYTGRSDKKGIKIFSGDIVKLEVLIEPVKWKGTYWVRKNLEVIFKINYQCYFPERLNESVVIGNIYQNPELREDQE